MKLGYCNETPRDLWLKCSKGDENIRTPRILGRCRTALRIMIKGMSKHLDPSDTHAIVLNNKNKKGSSNNSISSCSANNEEKSDSELSSEEEDIDSKVVSASDKAHASNSAIINFPNIIKTVPNTNFESSLATSFPFSNNLRKHSLTSSLRTFNSLPK